MSSATEVFEREGNLDQKSPEKVTRSVKQKCCKDQTGDDSEESRNKNLANRINIRNIKRKEQSNIQLETIDFS